MDYAKLGGIRPKGRCELNPDPATSSIPRSLESSEESLTCSFNYFNRLIPCRTCLEHVCCACREIGKACDTGPCAVFRQSSPVPSMEQGRVVRGTRRLDASRLGVFGFARNHQRKLGHLRASLVSKKRRKSPAPTTDLGGDEN